MIHNIFKFIYICQLLFDIFHNPLCNLFFKKKKEEEKEKKAQSLMVWFSVQRRCGDGERAKNSSGLDVEAKKKKKKLTLLLSMPCERE